MNTSKKIKIWTIICHALIIFGAGHGFGPLIFIELVSFPYFTHEEFSFLLSAPSHFPVVGLFNLLGQVALVISITERSKTFKLLLQILGICFLWVGLLYLAYDTTKDYYTHLSLISCLPFATCTMITFLSEPAKKLFEWATK